MDGHRRVQTDTEGTVKLHGVCLVLRFSQSDAATLRAANLARFTFLLCSGLGQLWDVVLCSFLIVCSMFLACSFSNEKLSFFKVAGGCGLSPCGHRKSPMATRDLLWP